MSSQLVLDQKILWWMFLPIVYVTLLLNIVRMYYSKYNSYKTLKKPIKLSSLYRDHQDKNIMTKCQLLTKKYPYMTQQAFNSRRAFLCAPQTGYLMRQRQPAEMTDPVAQMQGMMDSMGGTFPFIVASIATIGWINYSFGATLLAKVPFNLSQQYKTITQSGIQMQNLNVQYISGISFYILIMMGLGQVNSLLFNDEDQYLQLQQNKKKLNANQMSSMNKNTMSPMSMPMMNPTMGMPQQPDQNQKQKQMFKSQIQNLSIIQHHFAFDHCKKNALDQLKKFLNQT